MNAPREREIAVPGGSLHVWESGSGPIVVLLHGGPGLSDYTYTLSPELEDAYLVIRFQQRGLEPSTRSGPFDVERHQADAIRVLDALEVERACVVGSSWGGHLAMHLAVSHPDRVSGLVPVDPLGAVGDGGKADVGRVLLERLPPEAARQAAELDEQALAGGDSDEQALEAFRLMWPAYFAEPERAPPMPPMALSQTCYSQTMDSVHDHLSRRTLEKGLSSVRVPAMFVLGEKSPLPVGHGEATAALIPGARCQIEKGCGHFLWMERPGAVRRAVDVVHAQA